MKIEQFKAGVWRQQYKYKSFAPNSINHVWTWDDPSINTLLEQATRAIGELNAFSLIVPDIDVFIEMHVVKEAQTSSKIEGTQTAIDEALLPEAEVAPEKRDDWREVRNYIEAMNRSIADLRDLPLSNRLLCKAHATLMRDVRGKHKQPGDFRTSQNWIGGSSLADAVFIPPHPDDVPGLMTDLERFWHNETIAVPHLVRAAISHYQFETIHPYLDGNGRIGRLLITLYLVSNGLLAKPSLYLSDFFERNRASYYDALMRVRVANDLSHWIRFFLRGIAETATKGRDTFRKILSLRTEVEQNVSTLGKRSVNGRAAVNYLYSQPMVTAASLSGELRLSKPTGHKLVDELVRLKILRELTGRQKHRIYAFHRYLELFSS
jgi:Fic family protein